METKLVNVPLKVPKEIHQKLKIEAAKKDINLYDLMVDILSRNV